MRLGRRFTQGRVMAGLAGVAGAALMLLCSSASQAQEQPAQPPPEEVAVEIAVVGQHQGPQMWRVTSGDHVLWLLGTLQPLPKKLTWDARDVDKLLGEVQEVIPEYIALDVGSLAALRLYPKWKRIQVLKDGQTLQQVLPPDVYAQFSVLRDRYGNGPTDMEHLQPVFAAQRLKEEAIDKTGLTAGTHIQETVLKLARQHHVTVRNLTLQVRDSQDLLEEAGELPIEAQAACFQPVVAALNQAMGVLSARANAWALGDVQTLRTLQPVNTRGASLCWQAAAGGSHIAHLGSRLHKLWMDAVNDALKSHQASLAVQDIDSLLGGMLAELQAAGYSIEGPDFSGPAKPAR